MMEMKIKMTLGIEFITEEWKTEGKCSRVRSKPQDGTQHPL